MSIDSDDMIIYNINLGTVLGIYKITNNLSPFNLLHFANILPFFHLGILKKKTA